MAPKVKLHISQDLSLPLEAVTETFAFLATRGAGKTYAAGVFVEELLKVHEQVVVVDPMSAWWGLRSSADGRGPGFGVAILGGDHGDVPLEETGGELVADMIVNERLSAILDLSDMTKNARRRFVTDFAERLYHRNREAMHVVFEEADMFAPQNPRGDERMLGAIEEIVRRGRQRGLGTTLITQRSSVINKNVLELTENLVILRNLGPRSRAAIKDWIEHHGTEEDRKVVMDSLQKLPTGTGWVFSPYFLETLERIQFRKKKTFDSSATPRPGQRRRVPKTVADVDLGVLQERMAATIERARSEDPKELRRHIARLRKEIAGRPTEAVIETRVEHVEVPVFKDSEVKRLESAIDKLSDVGSELVAVAKEIGSALTSVQRIATGPSTAAAEQPRESRPRQSAHLGAAPHRGGSTTKAGQRVPVARPAPVPRADDVQIKAGARRILEALARYPSGELTRSQIGVMAKFKITGGTFQTYMSVLKRAGLN